MATPDIRTTLFLVRIIVGAKSIIVEDPYIRAPHQIANFVRLCETVLKASTVQTITLITSYDEKTDMADVRDKLDELKQACWNMMWLCT